MAVNRITTINISQYTMPILRALLSTIFSLVPLVAKRKMKGKLEELGEI